MFGFFVWQFEWQKVAFIAWDAVWPMCAPAKSDTKNAEKHREK